MSENCSTCGRSTAACSECMQEWPDGEPGYHDANGWHNGPRPTAHRPRELVKAEKKADDAQARYDQARNEWERIASDHYTARHRSTSEAITIIDNDGRMREIGPVDFAALRKLAEHEESAREAMAQAGEQLVAARMEHRAATSAAHRATA